MLNVDDFKAQARKLVTLLAAHQGPVLYQDALDLLARAQGNRSWKALSAKLVSAQPQGSPRPHLTGSDEPVRRTQHDVPGIGFLYRVPVTVDTSMTAYVQARGLTRDDAIEAARDYAFDGNVSFDIDEGNYRGRSDHYCPDAQAVEREAGEIPAYAAVVKSETEAGAQAGAYLVELTDLGDGEDSLLWADLRVFIPDLEEGEPVSCLSSIAADTPVHERQQFCLQVATLMQEAFPVVETLDLRTATHFFTVAVQAGDDFVAAKAILNKTPR